LIDIFSICAQLETFILEECPIHVFDFLAQQRCLKNLRLNYADRLPVNLRFPGNNSRLWDNMSFQLEKFELIGTDIGHFQTATKFFEWQQSLREVSLTFDDEDIEDYFDEDEDFDEEDENLGNSPEMFRRLFATISGLPFLKVFRITHGNCFLRIPGIVKNITNQTVEVLEIEEHNYSIYRWNNNRVAERKVIENLMKVFVNVKEVQLKVTFKVLEFNNFPHSKLPCVEFAEKEELEKFIYKPLSAPTEDIEAFQRDVFAFLERNGENLRTVEIDNVEWTRDTNFSLRWDLLSAALTKMPELKSFHFVDIIMRTVNNPLGVFKHQPISSPEHQQKFEEDFFRFAKQNSSLKCIKIGRREWENFTLSPSFIKELIETLPELFELQVANTLFDFNQQRFKEMHKTLSAQLLEVIKEYLQAPEM
jgi:hypothetical protein